MRTDLICTATEFKIDGLKNEDDYNYRNWDGLDKKPFLRSSNCIDDKNLSYSKLTNVLTKAEFLCSNYTDARFATEIFCAHDYNYILINQCNDTALCISKGINSTRMDLCKQFEQASNFFTNTATLISITIPILGALSSFFYLNIEFSNYFHHCSTAGDY